MLVPGAAGIAFAYSLGCIVAWELFHPVGGHVHPWHMLESAVYTTLLDLSGARLGARLLLFLPAAHIRRLFIIVLVVMGIQMGIHGLK